MSVSQVHSSEMEQNQSGESVSSGESEQARAGEEERKVS